MSGLKVIESLSKHSDRKANPFSAVGVFCQEPKVDARN